MIRAAIFDAYGTLLDVHSAMAAHADRLGPDWRAISEEWRAKQLEYTWVRSLLPDAWQDFRAVTRDALDYVAARRGIADAALLDTLADAYHRLDPYPEAPGVLRRLKDAGIPCVILSNGTVGMLGDVIEASGLAPLLTTVLSVDTAGVFKPAPAVYRLATDRFGPAGDLAFISANPWDGFGALRAGFRVFRVNRGGLPDEYGLRGAVTEIADLSPLPGLLAADPSAPPA